ncbi:MAG: hypothetical protein CM15mP106_2310 [Candidatus Neomarinimicrobiota bacterium]|nr:MAG: hypothetical protein CM15mP106_2310 [Candidatus Neomarinimicrobiota bacterium]
MKNYSGSRLVLRSQAQFSGLKFPTNCKLYHHGKNKNESITNVIINPGAGFGTGSHPTQNYV